jgi:hypothetical protein
MECYRNGGCGPYEQRSCSECPASKPEYLTRNTKSSIGFNIKEFMGVVEAINKPSVIIYGSSSTIDFLKEHWVEKAVKAQFCTFDYDDDRIFVMPAEGIEKPITIEIEGDSYENK